MASQLAQLGLGAYGVSQMMKKEGGVIKMAEGGIAEAAPQGSVPNTMPIDKLRSVLGGMSEEQLDQVAQGAGDATTLALVQEQKTLNARMRNANILAESIPQSTIKDEMVAADEAVDSGIAAAPLPASMFADTAVGEAPEEPAMRGGGIVAFAKGKEVKETKAAPTPADTFSADIAAVREMKPEDAFTSKADRMANIKEGVKFTEELMGTDKTIEMAEKIAKASELSPEAESRAKMAAAFEMMAAFGEPTPFATAFGRAGAIAGRNIKEYEKLKRESDLKANQIRLDTARYERAEKRGNIGEATKFADRIEDNNKALYALENEKAKTLATIQQTRESDELRARTTIEAAHIGAGPGYAAARKLDFGTQILQRETAKGMSDWQAKNPGKQPTPADIANINAAAGERAANLTKQYSGQIGQERIDLARQDKIEEALNKWKDSATGNRQLRDAAKEDKKAGIKLDDPNSLTYKLEQRKRKEYEAIFGGGAAQPAPAPAPASASAQQQQPRTIDFSSIR
jgi:hypothetical protein